MQDEEKTYKRLFTQNKNVTKSASTRECRR